MKKLIFVNRFFYPDHSATSQILTDLAVHLSAQADFSAQIHIVTSRLCYDNPTVKLPATENHAGVNIHRVWSSRFGRKNILGRLTDYLSFYLSATWQLWHLTGKHDVLVAKTDPPLMSVLAAMVARSKKAKLINWLQDLFPEVLTAVQPQRLPAWANRWLCRWRNRSLQAAACNVVIGEQMAQRVRQLGVAAAQIKTIPNWADEQQLQPCPQATNPLRAAWGLTDKFVVAYSGNLGWAHDHAAILALIVACQPHESIQFLFIGGGTGMVWLRRQVHSQSLQNVQFQPYQLRDDLANSLSVADVHVLSLRPELEGLIVPSKFYGVLAVGRPSLLLGAENGEIGKLINEHHLGQVCLPQHLDAAKNYLLALQVNTAQWQRCSHAARTYSEQFSKRAALRQWQQVLTSVLR